MAQITLLDGGMGQELVHRAGDRPTPLWSTRIMADHPGMVAAVHADYAAAGAAIATTNTYAIHHDRLVGTPLEGAFAKLHAAALSEVAGVGTRIAGSIGPLIASYRPDIHPDHDVAVPLYREVAETIAPACDLILCETVASVSHARAVLEGASVARLPVWLALTVDDTDGSKLRSGEDVADVLKLTGYDAILANCSAPEAIPAALAIFARGTVPFGGYANAFTRITKEFLMDKPTVDALEMRAEVTPQVYAAHALHWADLGATIIGGCCEVSPAHIAETARALKAAGHTIV